jgi:hypothetical protein
MLGDPQSRPDLERRVHVVEGPFIGRNLPVRPHVPFAAEEQDLVLGELQVDPRQDHRMEAQVPAREPGILPLVRHGDDVFGVEVPPILVAAAPALSGGGAASPSSQSDTIEVVELLGPKHARIGLPGDGSLVGGQATGKAVVIELVRLRDPGREQRLGIRSEVGRLRWSVRRRTITTVLPAGTIRW